MERRSLKGQFCGCTKSQFWLQQKRFSKNLRKPSNQGRKCKDANLRLQLALLVLDQVTNGSQLREHGLSGK